MNFFHFSSVEIKLLLRQLSENNSKLLDKKPANTNCAAHNAVNFSSATNLNNAAIVNSAASINNVPITNTADIDSGSTSSAANMNIIPTTSAANTSAANTSAPSLDAVRVTLEKEGLDTEHSYFKEPSHPGIPPVIIAPILQSIQPSSSSSLQPIQPSNSSLLPSIHCSSSAPMFLQPGKTVFIQPMPGNQTSSLSFNCNIQ